MSSSALTALSASVTVSKKRRVLSVMLGVHGEPGGGGIDGGGGDGGGEVGGGRGGKTTTASATVRALSLTPRLAASDEVTAEDERLVDVTDSASEAEPSMTRVMVTVVDVAIGAVTVTDCPSACATELVSALVSSADAVALALRLSAAPTGMSI